MKLEPNYTEFSDPRLVALYDTFNGLGADSEFMCQQAEKLSASSIIDLGCGTGLLTCELAKRGHKTIGVEPSVAMLAVARTKPYAEKVKWIEGGFEQMNDLHADMIFMTSHVAQFFIDDKKWQSMLEVAHKTLNSGGHLVFDIKNPLTKPWEKWTREKSSRKKDTTNGQVEMWYELREIKENRVLYEIHYFFTNSGEELISVNELIYRSQEEIIQSLSNVGFVVENIYGDWDSRPIDSTSPEMIFIAIRN